MSSRRVPYLGRSQMLRPEKLETILHGEPLPDRCARERREQRLAALGINPDGTRMRPASDDTTTGTDIIEVER